MTKYFVNVTDSADYTIEAETEEEAIECAWEWFNERRPRFEVKKNEEGADNA